MVKEVALSQDVASFARSQVKQIVEAGHVTPAMNVESLIVVQQIGMVKEIALGYMLKPSGGQAADKGDRGFLKVAGSA